MLRRLRATALASVLLATLAADAGATPQEQAIAEALFREGKASFEKKDYAVACRKFEESYRLDPAGGTQFALALCYEASGKVASAWVQFQAVLAAKGARSDRVETARARAAALEAKLPRVVVDVAKDARVDGLEVRNDGTLLGASSFGVALPVDPGPHQLSVRAPGRSPHEESYEITIGERRTITVRPLDPFPAAPAVIPAAPSSPPPPASTTPAPPPPPIDAHPGTAQRTLAIVAGGVGLVGVGVGTYFGLTARSKARTANDKCPGATCADDAALTAIDDGRSAARVANVAFAVGGIGIAAAAVLWLTAPPREGASLRVAPAIGAREGGVVASGTFR